MTSYIVTHTAVVGRSEDNEVPPMELTFYTIHKAASAEAAQDQVVQYNDATFKTRVENISEVGDEVSIDELAELMAPDTVFKLMG